MELINFEWGADLMHAIQRARVRILCSWYMVHSAPHARSTPFAVAATSHIRCLLCRPTPPPKEQLSQPVDPDRQWDRDARDLSPPMACRQHRAMQREPHSPNAPRALLCNRSVFNQSLIASFFDWGTTPFGCPRTARAALQQICFQPDSELLPVFFNCFATFSFFSCILSLGNGPA